MKRKFIFAAALFAAVSMVACSEDDNNASTPVDPTESYELSGNITEDLTLVAGESYKLSGAVLVKEGATLTIPAGTEIVAVDDDVVDYILIEQGAKIDAQGTASNPIVMTSESKKPGAWGGVHICGYASTNAGDGKSEIGNASYGGDNDADNSGIMKYVRLEYTGYAFDEEHEANGLSLYGVGSGTELSYIQAYRGSDDGFEFFGGTVNVSYMVATSCSDDSFDWTDGWRGKAQFLVAYHEDEDELGYACDCLLECDNNGDDNGATPASRPIISNVTLVGNNSATKTDGVMLKAGTQVELHNAIITGKTYSIYTKTTVVEDALKSGASKLMNIAMSTDLYSKEGVYTNADFVADATNSTNYINELTNNYVGIVEGGSTPSDSFFVTADYKGAIDPSNDWTAGWVKTAESQDLAEVVTLEGETSSDVTIAKNSICKLSGAYIVKAGATLTIEEGVQVIAIDDDLVDYILIEQGAKIDAQGTASNPIVMTSELEKPGAWGGVHICGYASTNAGEGKSEIGNATYGGDNDADNSGVMKYVRLEYTGYAFDEEHEANGLSLYGVGNGTEISYVQAYRGSDDGFEFFGGTVNVSYLVATSCSDDSFDWTDGWRGNAQFLVAYHENEDDLGYSCDCLLECDNNGDDNSATPTSHPVIANATLVGNNSATKTDGVMLKAGTEIELYNSIVTGKQYCVYIKTDVTDAALKSGASLLSGIFMSSGVNNASSAATYTTSDFTAAGNSTSYVNALADNYVGSESASTLSLGSFFVATDYAGAIKDADSDWTLSWTK